MSWYIPSGVFVFDFECDADPDKAVGVAVDKVKRFATDALKKRAPKWKFKDGALEELSVPGEVEELKPNPWFGLRYWVAFTRVLDTPIEHIERVDD